VNDVGSWVGIVLFHHVLVYGKARHGIRTSSVWVWTPEANWAEVDLARTAAHSVTPGNLFEGSMATWGCTGLVK
jgi:hypothetical protein